MARHSVERVLAAARAADPHFDRLPRHEAPPPRPLSTGNLLADCERWCRDHLTPRAPGRSAAAGRQHPRRQREAEAAAVVQLAHYKAS